MMYTPEEQLTESVVETEYGCGNVMADGLSCNTAGESPMLCDSCLRKFVQLLGVKSFDRMDNETIIVDGRWYGALSDEQAACLIWNLPTPDQAERNIE